MLITNNFVIGQSPSRQNQKNLAILSTNQQVDARTNNSTELHGVIQNENEFSVRTRESVNFDIIWKYSKRANI